MYIRTRPGKKAFFFVICTFHLITLRPCFLAVLPSLNMPTLRYISIVGCQAEGEVGDIIIGGVRDVPGKTMYEKLKHCLNHEDDLRQLLLNEPRAVRQ